MGGDLSGLWRKASTRSDREKLVIHLPGDELVIPTAFAQFLTTNTNGLTLSSNSPIMYKKSDI